MKFWRIAVPILIGMLWIADPPAAHGGADTDWAKHPKSLAGEFNNWTPQAMTGPDSNGLYRVTVRLMAGRSYQYKFLAAINGTDTQWETGFLPTGNRSVTIPSGADTFYVPMNWSDAPPKPSFVKAQIVAPEQVKITWTETMPQALDVKHGGGYNVYYRDTLPWYSVNTRSWTRANSSLIKDTTYTVTGLFTGVVYEFVITAIDAYGVTGMSPSDTPTPPGPLTETSVIFTDTPQGRILVAFTVDLRRDIAKSGKPPFGVGLVGSLSPLSNLPHQNLLKEISPGIYGETFLMQAGDYLRYIYVKNPGTSKEEFEGQKKEVDYLFRFDPKALSLAGTKKVYVRGPFNNWSDDEKWRMTFDTAAVSAARKVTFSYSAPTASKVTVAGTFNGWNKDQFALTNQGGGTWTIDLYLAPGGYEYKFVKDGEWEAGANRSLTVTEGTVTADDVGVFRLITRVNAAQDVAGDRSSPGGLQSKYAYKFHINKEDAPDGQEHWIGDKWGNNFFVFVTFQPRRLYHYATDTTVAAVYMRNNFDPYSGNWWAVDDSYALKPDPQYPGWWKWEGFVPILSTEQGYGIRRCEMWEDKTNDGLKNPTPTPAGYYWSDSGYLVVEIFRRVYLQSNADSTKLQLRDIWNADYAPLKSPVSLTAMSDSGLVRLHWRTPADVRVIGYFIYRDTDKTGTFPRISTITSDTQTDFYDTTVVNGTAYYYKVAMTVRNVGDFSTRDTQTSDPSTMQEGLPDTGGLVARRMADGQDRSVTVRFPDGSMPAGSYVEMASLQELFQDQLFDAEFMEATARIEEAENAGRYNPLALPLSENSPSDTDSLIYKIDVKTQAGQELKFSSAVTLSVPYSAAHVAAAAAAQAGGVQTANKMGVFVLNETTKRWEFISTSSQDPLSLTLSAPRYSFSTFQVMAIAGAPGNLNGMAVYPNPCYTNRAFDQAGNPYGDGRPGITFINVPTDMEYVKIYTITGELVRNLDPADPREYSTAGTAAVMIWDLQNDGGRPVATGVYLYFAKSATSTMKGKVAVIR